MVLIKGNWSHESSCNDDQLSLVDNRFLSIPIHNDHHFSDERVL